MIAIVTSVDWLNYLDGLNVDWCAGLGMPFSKKLKNDLKDLWVVLFVIALANLIWC